MDPAERRVSHVSEAWLLRWLAREPWLTARQCAELCWLEKETARRHLFALERAGLAQRLAVSDPELPRELVYALTDAGLHELARIEGRTVALTRKRYDAHRLTLVRAFLRLPFLFQVRTHFLCALVTQLREPQRLEVWNWWRSNKPLRRYYAPAPEGERRAQLLACHAYGVYVHRLSAELAVPFFLVWDSGLTRLKAERQRVGAFYLARFRLRAQLAPEQFPALVIVAASERRETEWLTLIEDQARLRADPAGMLATYVTSREALQARQPLAAIWRRPGRHAERVSLFQQAPGISADEYLKSFGADQWFNDRWEARLDFERRKPKWTGTVQDCLSVCLTEAPTERPPGALEQLARAYAGTSTFDRQLFGWIAQYRLATHSLLQGFYPRESDSVRQSLARLVRSELIQVIEPPVSCTLTEPIYALTPKGIELRARGANVSRKRYGRLHQVHWPPADADESSRRRVWSQIDHQLGVASYLLRFATSARRLTQERHSKQRLVRWDNRKTMGVSVRWRDTLFHFYPDAYGLYAIGSHETPFWLEADSGKYPLRHEQNTTYSFEQKARAYCAYYASLDARGRADECPKLLIVTSDDRRARGIRDLFRTVAPQLGMRVLPPAYVTTADRFLREPGGLLTPIWQRIRADERVHCFRLLDDLPPDARFSPLVTTAEFDAYTGPLVKAFVREQMPGVP